ncbi:Uma2 family endonuclease [Actinoplanes sp. NPDC049599]|uniref:Uma2 family endonuclease n=1 Tax=Actinoplanes sp. NPDC049599 TaxID=3363903 RepID=UPI0037B077B3
MTAAISGLPPADGWTVDDLYALPDDGVRRELIDGALHVSPSPTSVHQVIAMRLGVLLEQTCPEHLFVSQANDVELSPNRMFIPDVLVTTFEAARRRTGSFLADEVVLVAEIVSPGSQSVDRVLKPALYAKAGIPHYWLIETDGGLTVQTYRLNGDAEAYEPSGTFTDVVSTDSPWPIEIPVAALRPRNL